MAGNLAALQAALQQDIMEGTTQTLPLLSLPQEATPEKRLLVYQNAYVSRLVEILGKDYDTTWTYVGDQMFYDLASSFVKKHPSQTPNARWFGHKFPDFLSEEPSLAELPVIAEIADIERALNDAFDEADDPPMSGEDMAGLAGLDADEIRLAFHASTTLLRVETNSYDIFRACRNEDQPPAGMMEKESRWVLVWRTQMICKHMELEAEQGILLDYVRQGRNFAELCEISATIDDPEYAAYRMANYLGQWAGSGILSKKLGAG